jgi:hypothetical protein
MKPWNPHPIGVMPYYLWAEMNPDPTLAEVVDRYAAVQAAVLRYRDAGLDVKPEWLTELIGRNVNINKEHQ